MISCPAGQGDNFTEYSKPAPAEHRQAAKKEKSRLWRVAKKRGKQGLSLFLLFHFLSSLPSGVRNYELGVVNCMLGISKKCFLCFLLNFRVCDSFRAPIARVCATTTNIALATCAMARQKVERNEQ